jgi:hypothetical protein
LWAGASLLLAGCARTQQSQEKDKSMMSIWHAIDALARQVPFSKTKVEAALAVQLQEARRTSHTLFLEGGNVMLAEECRIAKVDLRLSEEANDPGFMVLDIDSACITLQQVRQHYPALEITQTPRGHSLDEATAHSAKLKWGKLSFGFKEREPECLAYVAFDPKK